MANGKRKTGKEVAIKRETGIVLTPPPDYIGKSGLGFEDIEKEDILLPRIKLLQALSPEVTKDKMKPGTMINSITQEFYPDEIYFTPLLFKKSRIYFKPREEGGGILCSSQDAKIPTTEIYAKTCMECRYKDWNTEAKTDKDKQPKCTVFYNFPCIVEGIGQPVALSLCRTKVKIGKLLISLGKYAGGNVDMFALRYKLSIVAEESQFGPYFNFKLEGAGYVTKEQYNVYKNLYQSLSTKKIEVDIEKEPETIEDEKAPF